MRSVQGHWARFVVIGVVLSKMVSCSGGGGGDGDSDGSGSSNEPVPVRISPVSVEGTDSSGSSAWALFDRDTHVGWSPPSTPPDSPGQVRVALGRATRITHLKIFGASPYVLAVRTGNGTAIQGLEDVRLDALGAGWNTLRLPDSTSTDELALELARTDGGDGSAPAPIGEIELWGVDRPTPMLDANAVGALATRSSSPATAPPGLDVVAVPDTGPIDLGPSSAPGEQAGGQASGQACGKIRFSLARSPASYRRAWLVYAADGAFRRSF